MDKDKNSPQEEGNEMSVLEKVLKTPSKLDRLKQRAEVRRNRSDLKHNSSKNNAKIFNSNFSDMETEINRTIK